MKTISCINYYLLFLSHQIYVNKVLHHCYMLNAKSVNTPIASHFKLASTQCPSSDNMLIICHEFYTLVLFILWCITGFVLVLIYLMLWVWSVDSWLIMVNNIRRLFSEFRGIFVALPKLVDLMFCINGKGLCWLCGLKFG
jgi:hypothetical protein